MSPKKKDEELDVSDEEEEKEEEEEEEKEEEEEEEESKQNKDDDDDDVDNIDKDDDDDDDSDKDDDDDDVVESKNDDDDDDDESPNGATSRNQMDSSNLPLNSGKSPRKTTKNQKAADDFVETPKSKENPISLSNEELVEIYEKKKKSKGQKEKFLLKDVYNMSAAKFVAVTPSPEDDDGDGSDNDDDFNQQYLISASSDPRQGSVKVFNFKTKKEVHQWENPHKGEITAMVVTSDAMKIITGSKDKSIKIFDLYMKDKDESEHFENVHKNEIFSLALSKDNKYLISGASESIKIFDLSTDKEISHIEDGKLYFLRTVAITPDNKFIIAGTINAVVVYDFQMKTLIKEFKDLDLSEITSMIVTDDNRYLIVASDSSKSIKMLDLQTKKEAYHFKEVDTFGIKSLTLTSDGRYLLSASYKDDLFKVHDLQTKQLVHSSSTDSKVKSMAVTSDSKYIIAGMADSSIKIFDFDPKLEAHHFKEAHEQEITSMVVTSDSKLLITGSEDNSIKVFDLQNKKQFFHYPDAHNGKITSVAVTSDNKFIISASDDKSIKVFDLQTPKEKEVYHFEDAHEYEINSVIVTPDSRFIISPVINTLKIWDFQTKKLACQIDDVHDYDINSLAVTSDSRFLVTCGIDSIKVFELDTFQEVYHLENAHEDEICSLTVTPDRRFIISFGTNGWIKMFDFQTKQLVREFQNLEQDEYFTQESIIVTSDSKYILYCSDSDSIQVIDIQTGKPIHQLKKVTDQSIGSFAVTPDNRYIIWSDGYQSIKMSEFHPNNEPQQNYIKAIVEKNQSEPKTPGSASKSTKIFDIKTREKEVTPSLNDNSRHLIKTPSLLNQEIYFVDSGMKKFSVFNNIDDFLFNKTTEISLTQALKQSDLFVLPFRWTILHLVSLNANHDFIAKMPEYKKFKMPFLLDSFDRTPMHYLIVQKNLRSSTINVLFRYICDYLDDSYSKNLHEFQKIIESLTSLLPFILQKIEAKLRCRFLQIACAKSSIPHDKPLPVFGTIESESTIFCRTPVLVQETREQIWGEQGTTQIEFRSNYLYLDYHILSQDMKEVVGDLKEQDGEEIFKAPAISTLIDHLWEQAERSLFLFFTLYSAFIIALSVYLTFNDRSLPYEIILIIAAGVLTANEFWQIYNLTKDYLRSPWNWIDLTQLLLTIAFLITRITDNENELARAWMSTIIVIFGYLRWISLLKIFKPTRNFIEVVITIVKAMISFTVVLAMIIVAFSIIFLVFNREAGYGDYLYEAYNVMYGPMDIDEEAAWPFSQKLLMAVLAFFLNVVLLNLLISIMGDAFGKAGEAEDKTDALTRLEMISEAMIFKKIVNPNHKTKRGYLVYCLTAELEEEKNDQQEQLKKMAEAIKQLQQNDEDSKKEYQSLKNEISGFKDQLSSLDAFIRSSLKK